MPESTSPPPRSSCSSSSPPPPPSSAVLSVLNRSRQDLWKRRLAPGCWPDTLRKYVLDPCHHFWSILLAPIVQQYKILDNGATARFMQVFVTMPLSLAFLIMSTTTSTSTAAVAEKTEQDARLNAKQDLLLQVTPAGPSSSSSSSLFMLTPPSDTSSAIKGAMAFVITATTDLIGAMLDSHRMNKWWQAIVAFTNYLQASGMSAHLQESIVKPLCRGRLFCNIKILNDIQEEVRCDIELLQKQLQSPHQQHKQNDPKNQVELLQEAGRMMRFATAAYGRDMVASAIDRQVSWEHINTEKKAIVVHTGLSSVDQIPVLVEGLGMAVLRHFIAIDTLSKSVVLAIRGTLDVSGALVDVQGMDCDYCLTHGRAHQGIAEQAENIWNASGSKLQELFNNNQQQNANTTDLKDYRLIITGHSLGAGAACLLNLKIHAENLFPGRTVLCYGFAPPPTFALQCPPDHEHDDDDDCTTMNDAGESGGKRDIPKTTTTSRAATIMSRQQLQQAMDHSYCFIHDNDCVPFLSVASVRRLSTLLDTVDNHTEHLWFWQRFQIFWEFTKIPRDITQAVHSVMKQKSLSVCSHHGTVAAGNDATSTTHAAGTTTTTTATTSEHQHVSLMIPASTVIWMKKMTHPQKNQNPFRAFQCCPSSLAQLDVFMSPDMLSDHLPEQYEDALDALNEEATAAAATTTATTTAAT